MARGINKVILVGNLTKDPDMRYMPDGSALAGFGVATSESWKGKDGEKQERTEFHNCTAFKKLAEIIGEYAKKGQQVYIEGKLHTEKYKDKQTGVDKYSTKIIVNDFQMLGGRSEAKPENKPAPAPAMREPSEDDFDDDIPFQQRFYNQEYL